MKKILAVLLFFSLAFAQTFPQLSGRVVDEAGIISPSAKERLDKILAAHETATSNQVVVATIKSLEGKDIESYALELGRHWGIGQKGKDNGVLLVVAPNDRSVRVEVGYGLEGVLTDAMSLKIINSVILPNFKDGKMETGIILGVKTILNIIDGDETNDNEPIVDEGVSSMVTAANVITAKDGLDTDEKIWLSLGFLLVGAIITVLGGLTKTKTSLKATGRNFQGLGLGTITSGLFGIGATNPANLESAIMGFGGLALIIGFFVARRIKKLDERGEGLDKLFGGLKKIEDEEEEENSLTKRNTYKGGGGSFGGGGASGKW